MKLNEESLVQLRARQAALGSVKVLAQMAQREFNLFVQEQLIRLGLDKSKQYNVDEKTGVISEIKSEPVKVNDSEESGEPTSEGGESASNPTLAD